MLLLLLLLLLPGRRDICCGWMMCLFGVRKFVKSGINVAFLQRDICRLREDPRAQSASCKIFVFM